MTETPLLKAIEFAESAHAGQVYGKQPYTAHLSTVSQLVDPFGEEAKILAWLHDIVEDTQITVDDIRNNFGGFMAECVDLISDPPGKNRKERKAKLYEKLSKIDETKHVVLVVKVADRLSNVAKCILDNNTSLLKMYVKEHNGFKEIVYRNGLCEDLWFILDTMIKNGSSNYGWT